MRVPIPLLPVLLLAVIGTACGSASAGPSDGGGGEGGGDGGAVLDPVELATDFVTRAVADWEGVDYSHQHPDGRTDSDGDGAVDANDAVIVVETLRALGVEAPPTVVQGLYENFHTAEGYAADPESDEGRAPFSYTRASPVTEADLKAGDWSGLAEGDLLFVDFDMDLFWDNAAVYLGPYGDFTHAAFLASDYYDEALVVDLDYEDEILVQDIAFGYAAVRSPDFEALASQ